jgi:hypothetical protein
LLPTIIPESNEFMNNPLTPNDDAMQNLVADTHRRTMDNLRNFRVIRSKQRELNLPDDEKTVDAMFERLVQEIRASRLPD